MIPKAYQERVCDVCGYRDPSVYRVEDREICAECWKRENGKTTTDIHHPYGRSRPETVKIPANLHAYLTEGQKRWPKIIKKLPNDPLLQIAYFQRETYDLIQWVILHPGELQKKQRHELILKANERSHRVRSPHALQEQVNQILGLLCYQFEECSDWLIAYHFFMVKKYGQDYYT